MEDIIRVTDIETQKIIEKWEYKLKFNRLLTFETSWGKKKYGEDNNNLTLFTEFINTDNLKVGYWLPKIKELDFLNLKLKEIMKHNMLNDTAAKKYYGKN